MNDMKKIFYFLLCSTFVLSINAQSRYLDYVFDEDQILVDTSIMYGSNYTILALPQIGHSLWQPLVMDLYHPDEDKDTPRPLIIYLHTGNFLPVARNGSVNGTLRDPSTVEACKRLARLGYVVASADYRQGWNPIAESQETRNYTLINAAYRGVQDARTAIRYFRKTVAEDENPYNIDTSRIVLWGQGTGGYISYAAATLDDYNEITATEEPPGKFFIDTGNGTGIPMVIEQINGDIYGTSLGISVGNPQIPDGDTLCLPNHVGYSSDFNLAVNMGGALGDIGWVDENTVPIISTQVPTDLYAPYNTFTLQVGTSKGPLSVVEVQGALKVHSKLASLGISDQWANIDDDITAAAKISSGLATPVGLETVGHDFYPGLIPFNKPIVTSAIGNKVSDSAPWDYWDKDYWSAVEYNPAGDLGLPDGFSFNDWASLANPDMSIDKCHAYLDSVIGFFAPRAVITLGINTDVAVQNVEPTKASFAVSPNPARSAVTIETVGEEYRMKSIQIFDLSGREVKSIRNIDTNRKEVNNLDLPSGMYIVKARMDKGIVSQKLIVQ